MAVWAPFSLLLVTAALLVLPVAPALVELRKRSDASPLPTSRHDGRITNFAEAFHARLEPLQRQFEQCRFNVDVQRTSIDAIRVLLVGRDNFNFEPSQLKSLDALMCTVAHVPAGRMIKADLWAQVALELEENSTIRAALSHGDVFMGRNSTVLRWLHADGNVYLREYSSAYGRLSARHSIELEPGCTFERMFAPLILTSGSYDEDPADDLFIPRASGLSSPQREVDDLNPHSQRAAMKFGRVFVCCQPRLRVQGDFVLSAGEAINANVIATGDVRIGRGSHVIGSAKSYHHVVVEDGASVTGSIVCGGNLYLGPRSFVAGPILVEGNAVIARGCRVGSPDSLTTISLNSVQIAAGCTLHGTCWARRGGRVED